MLSPLHHPGSAITTDSIAILDGIFCLFCYPHRTNFNNFTFESCKKRGLSVYTVGLSNLYVKHTNDVPTGHVKIG